MSSLRDDDSGASPVEFVLVGVLLSALTLAVLQLALIVYVRNIVHDAAVEGAYHGALADTSPSDGAAHTQRLIDHAVGSLEATVTGRESSQMGAPTVEVTVVATMPLLGFFGIPAGMEVTAYAPYEDFD